MAKRTELKVISYIIPRSFGINEPILVDDLTSEQIELYAKKMAQNAKECIETLFANRPEQLP